MRGSAVPTIVWSSAARNSASATPTVARIRALRVISAGICSLLGDGFDRVVEIRQCDAQARTRVGGESREHAGYTPLHDLVVFVELAAPLCGELDEHDAPIGRIFEPSDESVPRERIDELGKRRRGHRATLREVTSSHRALAKLPHHTGAVRRYVALLAVRGGCHLYDAQGVQEEARELEVLASGWGIAFGDRRHWFGLQIVRSPKGKGSAAREQGPRVSHRSQKRRTYGLAGAGLHERLLYVRGEELAPSARRTFLGLALAVRDGPAGFAPEMLLPALRAYDGGRLG